MSRCFPFPPPGYEKKPRPDDADLLKEEKQREKKHKKEKRDKEKREGKEKDRSDGKHKEKKDKKEKHRKDKHRDKKKDKEKDTNKDKDKIKPSEEKSIAEKSKSYDGEKLHRKEERSKDKSSSSSDEKKPAVQFHGHTGEKLIRNSLVALQSEESKFVQELGRRIRDEQEGTGPTGSQLADRFTGTEQKKDEGIDSFTVMYAGILAEGKEKNRDKKADSRKMDGQGIREQARFSGNAMAKNIAGMVQNKVDGMPRPMEKDIERRMEGKEKSKERGDDDKRGDKHKEKDGEKKSHGKDKNREKEKKKGEKAKEKSKHKKTDVNENDLVVLNNKTSHPSKDCNNNATAEGNLKKRKYVEMNGFLHHNEVGLNKMQRPTSSSLSDNGKKLEPCQTPGLFSSDGQGAANNLKVDIKERRVNGIIEAQPLFVPAMKPSSTATHVDHIAEASRKPPHPDSKYLSQVLSVPKMEEWSDFDDQDWLFSSKDPPASKPEVGSAGINQELWVWDEALHIESVDVCALPYVIPY